jgi:sugar lactone lactonase YvrE
MGSKKFKGLNRLVKVAASFVVSAIIVSMFTTPVFSEEYKMWAYTTLPGAPEGVCVDSKNNLYASITWTGEVVLLKDDGTYEHIAWVPSKEESGQGQLIGMDVDAQDNIYIAYLQFSKYIDHGADLFNKHHPACNDVRVTRSGVYKIDAKTREVTPVATRADGWPFCFPDDVDIDKAGNIYLTDLTYSGIWKISPDGKVTMWSDDPLLNPTDPVSSMGVNVCVLDKEEKNIYAATTTVTGRIVKIPINEDGSAGKAELFSTSHSPFDGIEIDDEGYIYASEPVLNQIIVLSPQGGGPWSLTPRKVIASGPPLQGPTSLVLRDGVLYTANLAFGLPPEKHNKTVVAIKGFAKK